MINFVQVILAAHGIGDILYPLAAQVVLAAHGVGDSLYPFVASLPF